MAQQNLLTPPLLPNPVDLEQIADEFVATVVRDGTFNFASIHYFNTAILSVPFGFQSTLFRLIKARLEAQPEALKRLSFSLYGGFISSYLTGLDKRDFAFTPIFPTPLFAYCFYASIAYAYGNVSAQKALRRGDLVLLALRRSSSTLANKGLGSYDDTVVVLKGLGETRFAACYPICTEPGAQYSARAASLGNDKKGHSLGRVDPRYAGVTYKKTDGEDINKDGIKDAGRLVEGTYLYYEKAGGYLGGRAFQVKTTQVAERDTDGDGYFNANDPSRIDATGAQTSMYIHRGGEDTAATPNTWSAGCQTIPKNRYGDFLGNIPKSASFNYVLVNAS
jgi:hypothetical protein